MSIRINVTGTVPFESTIEVTEEELDIMVAEGVDVRDEDAAADFYARNAGKTLHGHRFASASEIAEDWNTKFPPEIEDWCAEGEAPDRFWPEESDDEVSA